MPAAKGIGVLFFSGSDAMLLKRLFDETDLAAFRAARSQLIADAGLVEDHVEDQMAIRALVREHAHELPRPRVVGVNVVRAKPTQHFSPNILETGQREGWMTVSGNVVTILSDPPVVYRIVRVPGYYCCHCQRPLDDGGVARAHLAAEHDGEGSPDPSNPAGYRRDNFYACAREA